MVCQITNTKFSLLKDKYMVKTVPVNEIYQNGFMFLGRLMANALLVKCLSSIHILFYGNSFLKNEITLEDIESLDAYSISSLLI